MEGPLRLIFAVAVLAMWALFGVAVANGAWTSTLWAVLLVAHVACAIVFYNFAYVFSYGYAISVVAANLIIVARYPSLAGALVAGACIAYGLRLWQFVHARQRDPSYRGVRDRSDAAGVRAPVGLKIGIWIMVSWLMAFHAMTTWNVASAGRVTPWIVAGVLMMIAGIALEAVADAQKLAAKRGAPQRWVSAGLYRWVRHPNYLGEIVFQAGLIVAGLGSTATVVALLAGVIAPAYIVVLMLSESWSLDRKQQERYGADPQFRTYFASTGRLLPVSPAGNPAAPR
jgi:steroid 5-alpha reductase family enzyme